MDQSAFDELVSRCLEYEQTRADELFWAWDKITEILMKSADEGFELVRALVERSPDKAVLFNVAAGPLEDLLARHGPEVIDRILEVGRSNEKMRFALARGVWGRNRIRADVQEKLVKFANEPRS